MAKEFEIDAYRRDSELLVVLRGRLVLKYAQEVKNRLTNLLTPQIVQAYLYLSELNFLDSAGLGVLVGLKMQANKNRTGLVFLSPPARIEDIFRVSKLDTIFEIRGGSEADVTYAMLHKPEYCLWQDSKDMQQTAHNTEIGTDGGQMRGLTQMAHETPSEGDAGQRVRKLCDDAAEFIRQADYGRAVEQYEQALELDRDNLTALNNLGIVLEKKPEWYARSLEIWRRVLEVSNTAHDEKHASRASKHIESLSKLTGIN